MGKNRNRSWKQRAESKERRRETRFPDIIPSKETVDTIKNSRSAQGAAGGGILGAAGGYLASRTVNNKLDFEIKFLESKQNLTDLEKEELKNLKRRKRLNTAKITASGMGAGSLIGAGVGSRFK